MLIAFWYASASFFAFHMMFDRSNLLSGEWLSALNPNPPRRWVQISIFLEENTLPLGKLFSNAEGRSFDLFDSKVTTEPAIARARELSAGSGATAVSADALLVGDDWADLTVVMLAAHEIRDRFLREKLFVELHRITCDNGTVILNRTSSQLCGVFSFRTDRFSPFLSAKRVDSVGKTRRPETTARIFHYAFRSRFCFYSAEQR